MPDRVDAPMQAMQSAASQSQFDRAAAHTGREQLSASDNPVLPLSQRRQEPVDSTPQVIRTAFAIDATVNAVLVACTAGGRVDHLASVAEFESRVARWMSNLSHEKGSNPPLPPLALIP